MKKAGFHGYVYDFSVGYDNIKVFSIFFTSKKLLII